MGAMDMVSSFAVYAVVMELYSKITSTLTLDGKLRVVLALDVGGQELYYVRAVVVEEWLQTLKATFLLKLALLFITWKIKTRNATFAQHILRRSSQDLTRLCFPTSVPTARHNIVIINHVF